MPKILMPYTVHLDHTLRVTPLNTLFAKGVITEDQRNKLRVMIKSRTAAKMR